ncbi:MAG: carboxymuconolactone decarboxylase family protein [Gammaproteobacteria bacterium]|jgi:uncharacterized peroxidase-related enzyme
MAFIDTVNAADATGDVRDMYARQQRSYGFVPHYATIFSHRPGLMKLWSDLLYGIRCNMDKRRFELVTVAAAMAVRSTYCSLAHARALMQFYSGAEVLAIVSGAEEAPLSDAEVEMMRFARKIVTAAADTTADDVARLRNCGFGEAEIFDIAAAATARTFFAQLCEGLGTTGDHMYDDMDRELRRVLAVGRAQACVEPQKLAGEGDRAV